MVKPVGMKPSAAMSAGRTEGEKSGARSSLSAGDILRGSGKKIRLLAEGLAKEKMSRDCGMEAKKKGVRLYLLRLVQ